MLVWQRWYSCTFAISTVSLVPRASVAVLLRFDLHACKHSPFAHANGLDSTAVTRTCIQIAALDSKFRQCDGQSMQMQSISYHCFCFISVHVIQHQPHMLLSFLLPLCEHLLSDTHNKCKRAKSSVQRERTGAAPHRSSLCSFQPLQLVWPSASVHRNRCRSTCCWEPVSVDVQWIVRIWTYFSCGNVAVLKSSQNSLKSSICSYFGPVNTSMPLISRIHVSNSCNTLW